MRLRATMCVLAVAALLAGCSAEPPTRDELVGTWVHGDTRLTLSDDGTFTLTDAPDYTLFTSDVTWRTTDGSTRDASGDWSIEPDAVRLSDAVLGNGEKLFFGESGELLFGLEMGSSLPRCFELVRADSGVTPRGPQDCTMRR